MDGNEFTLNLSTVATQREREREREKKTTNVTANKQLEG
jgi:hypothetical protein